MIKGLQKTINDFKNSKTSLESYEAISDFVKIIETYPKFIKQIKKEGENIRIERVKLNKDKGLNLKYKDRKIHNEKRGAKDIALHQLDPMFPFRNLYNVLKGIQPKNINDNSIWLFPSFGPDDPLPKSDRKEYQLFIDKAYKKIALFLGIEEKIDFGFDLDRSVLHFQGEEIKISLRSNKTNAHYVLKHIFKSDDLNQEFYFREISEETFKDNEYLGWNKFYRACEDIKKKVYEATGINDFIKFSTGKTALVKINKKYLK